MIPTGDVAARGRWDLEACPDGNTGFTLVELIVVVVLIGILASAISGPLIQGLKAREEVASDLDTIGKLRYATERIVRELRQVQHTASSGGFQLTPIDASGSSSGGVCLVRVGGVTGTTLTTVAVRRNASLVIYDLPATCTDPTPAPTTLADGAANLNFDYFGFVDPNVMDPNVVDPDGDGLFPVAVGDANFGSKVNVVDITMTLNTPGGAALTQRTRVLLQNGVWGSVF